MNTTRVSAIAAAVLIGAAFFTAYAFHPKVRSLQDLQKSTVSLTMADGATCSGWVLAGSHKVITAAHCVSDEPPVAPVQVDFHDGTGKHLFIPEKVGDVEGTKPDLAVLIPMPNMKLTWPAGLAPCPFKPTYLEPVYLFGDPLGFQQVITIGSIASPSQPFPSVRDAPYIQYDGSLTPGDSGGAVVDIKHQCVIASADGLLAPPAGDPIKFLEPVSRLGEL